MSQNQKPQDPDLSFDDLFSDDMDNFTNSLENTDPDFDNMIDLFDDQSFVEEQQLITNAETIDWAMKDNNFITHLENIDIEDVAVNPSDHDEDELSENWVAIASQLHEDNQKLVAKVAELEKALALKNQQMLEAQKNQSKDLRIAGSQEKNTLPISQEQLSDLLRQLDASGQNAQRQKILIDTLSEQLKVSNQQVAKLERECAVIQENYNQQTYKLLESEKQAQELRYRLQRQQRYTLQFKSALEQCLSIPNDTVSISDQTESLISNPSVVPKIKSIQPWTVETNPVESLSKGNNTQSNSVKSVESNYPSPEILSEKKTQSRTKVELPKFLSYLNS